jgi:8-oxo-dGTP diphosphatase
MPEPPWETPQYRTGVAILHGWRYCPRCAAELRREDDRVECGACGFCHYASSSPTASAFILDGDGRVLLARRAIEPDAGLWDVPGGFLEEGEDPVDGLRRELREETGLEIEVGDFVGLFTDTYGDGPDASHVLNLVWETRLAAGEPVPGDDVAELRWFPKDALPSDVELAFRWLSAGLRDWTAKPRNVLEKLTPPGRARGVEYYATTATSPSARSSADFGWAPTAAAAGAPSLNRIIVGIDMTP